MRVPPSYTGYSLRRGTAVLGAGILACCAVLVPVQARADVGPRVDLRVLVLLNGATTTNAVVAQLDREGVPYRAVNLDGVDRVAITEDFLADTPSRHGRYQAVVVNDPTGGGLLSAEERSALASYERDYGVRQVNTYTYPGAGTGMATPGYSGPLDGAEVTVSSAGLGGPFAYLRGTLTIDDFSPAVDEVYGYLSQGAPDVATGETFTPMLQATNGTTAGTIAGVYGHDGREELVITTSYSQHQQWFNVVGHGIVTWMTRGLHLGYHRNYFAVQIDDVLMADGRWSPKGNCTAGADCTDPTIPVQDIRMTSSDVTRLKQFQTANGGWAPDLVFNAYGSVLAGNRDPLTAALTAWDTRGRFTWINHTYSHPFLGCVQIPLGTDGSSWRCATPADPKTSYENPDLTAADLSVIGNTVWTSQAKIRNEISNNTTWAAFRWLSTMDRTALVTGEHSGLATLPQQVTDNPNLAPALSAAGIRYLASDASRENESRTVGTAVTVPRHPMNIYYNVGTYQEEVSEYNWIYTSAPDGGSGLCTANPATSTCITPLDASDAAAAERSFRSYIVPAEARTALGFVLTGDPRPFFAHQSNLAEDGVLYPVMQAVLDGYAAVVNKNVSPLVRTDLRGQAEALTRSATWSARKDQATAYVDGSGVHVSAPAGTQVPLTVPTGTTVRGVAVSAYDGERSGWFTASTTDVVVAVPATAIGGYGSGPAPVPTTTTTEPTTTTTTTTTEPTTTATTTTTEPTTTTTVPTTTATEPTTTVPTTTVPTTTVPTTTVPTTTSSTARRCRVDYVVDTQWSTGFVARATVVNTSTAVINGWTLRFTLPSGQRVTSFWNGSATQNGSEVTVRNLSYNGILTPLVGTAWLGFQGSLTGANVAPTDFTLNGTPCTVS